MRSLVAVIAAAAIAVIVVVAPIAFAGGADVGGLKTGGNANGDIAPNTISSTCLTTTGSAVTLGCNTTTASNTSITAGTNGTFILGGGTSNYRVINVTDIVVAPTVTACSGGTAASVTWNNGSASLRFDVGTSCAGENTAVITMGTTANCWTCDCWNVGARAQLMQSACTTTSATITNMGTSVATPADWTDGADIQCMCRGG